MSTSTVQIHRTHTGCHFWPNQQQCVVETHVFSSNVLWGWWWKDWVAYIQSLSITNPAIWLATQLLPICDREWLGKIATNHFSLHQKNFHFSVWKCLLKKIHTGGSVSLLLDNIVSKSVLGFKRSAQVHFLTLISVLFLILLFNCLISGQNSQVYEILCCLSF